MQLKIVDRLNYFWHCLDMKLQKYLKDHNISLSTFSKKLGVTTEAVRLWCIGQKVPHSDTMVTIYHFTKGEVCPNDFYNLEPLKSSKPPSTTHSIGNK